jgi:vesicular inhibitory amino acid transporter
MFALLTLTSITWKTSILIGRSLNGDPRPLAYFDDYGTSIKPGYPPYTAHARMRKKISSFPDIAQEAFGHTGCVILSTVLYFELFSSLCIYIVFMGDHLHKLFPSVAEAFLIVVAGIASIAPMILLDSARLLSYLSMVGTCATVAVVSAVFFAAVFEGDITERVAENMDVDDPGPYHIFWNASGLPLAYGLVAYCFSGHAIVPSIYSSMQNPREFERVVDVTYSVVTASCIIVAVSGYWMFGSLVLDQVTLSLAENSSALIAMTILTYMMVLTAFSKTTLTMFPLSQGFEDMIAPYLTSDRAMEVAAHSIKMTLLFLAVIVAIFVPSFSFLCALVGMICTMFVSVIFPAAAHLKLFYSNLGRWEILMDWIFIMAGLATAIVGTWLGL